MVELDNQYPDDTIPLPPNWGGFIVSPSRIEFWLCFNQWPIPGVGEFSPS
jgi:pyridoxine/pyridoxamine 5'-phosphate oxidase